MADQVVSERVGRTVQEGMASFLEKRPAEFEDQ